jgi:hypothetical protein
MAVLLGKKPFLPESTGSFSLSFLDAAQAVYAARLTRN